MSIFLNDYSLFKHALTRLVPGQVVRISGTNQLGGTHSLETFIVKTVDENEVQTTTGLIFHYTKITHIGYTEQVVAQDQLPHLHLTGELENFPSEPE